MIYCQAGYTRYIPGIYYAYTMPRSLASPLKCPLSFGSLRPRVPLDLLSFGHRDAAHTRLGPSKPGVDLVNMAAPLQVRATPLAQQHSKVSFCLLLYLCGIIEIPFPSRKHGMRGTLQRRSSTLAM
jgi:hypothetical protein